jgi:hypothetical protein
MDYENLTELNRRKPPFYCNAKILLLGDFDEKNAGRVIRDPYYVSVHKRQVVAKKVTQMSSLRWTNLRWKFRFLVIFL